MTTLSVFETMGEMLRLSAKHFRLLLVVGIVQAVPDIASSILSLLAVAWNMKYLPFWFVLPLLVITFILQAVCRAAVIGVLAEPAPELALTALRTAIRTRTWTLVRVSILLILIAIPVEIVFGMFATMFIGIKSPGVVAVFSIAFGVLFIIFLKYALADPLVVTRGIRARESLQISWRMTRGHFGYVLLCYLLLGGVLAVMGFASDKLSHAVTTPYLVSVVASLINTLLATTWIVLAWVMYTRIMEAEAQLPKGQPTSY